MESLHSHVYHFGKLFQDCKAVVEELFREDGVVERESATYADIIEEFLSKSFLPANDRLRQANFLDYQQYFPKYVSLLPRACV